MTNMLAVCRELEVKGEGGLPISENELRERFACISISGSSMLIKEEEFISACWVDSTPSTDPTKLWWESIPPKWRQHEWKKRITGMNEMKKEHDAAAEHFDNWRREQKSKLRAQLQRQARESEQRDRYLATG